MRYEYNHNNNTNSFLDLTIEDTATLLMALTITSISANTAQGRETALNLRNKMLKEMETDQK